MAAIHWCRNSGEVGKRSSANISHLQLSRGVLCCRHMLGPRTFLLRWLFVQLQSAQCRPIEHSQEYDILSAGQRNKRKNSGGVVDCADGWGTGNIFNSPVQDATLIFRVPSWSRWVEGERVKRSTGELIWSAVCLFVTVPMIPHLFEHWLHLLFLGPHCLKVAFRESRHCHCGTTHAHALSKSILATTSPLFKSLSSAVKCFGNECHLSLGTNFQQEFHNVMMLIMRPWP